VIFVGIGLLTSSDVNKTFLVKTKARLYTRTATEQISIHFVQWLQNEPNSKLIHKK